MKIKKLTDKQVAEHFKMGDRNLQQTYKNPKPTKQKEVLTPEEVQDKKEQYEVLRLGATCKEYGLSEEQLIKAIDFAKSLEK